MLHLSVLFIVKCKANIYVFLLLTATGFDAFPDPDNLEEVRALHTQEPNVGDGQIIPLYKLYKKHRDCLSVWDEWHGLREFSSNNNGVCFSGGIQELESRYKNLWRKSFSPAECKHFSRIKSIVHWMKAIVEEMNETDVEARTKIHEMLETEDIKQVTTIEKRLRKHADEMGLDAAPVPKQRRLTR